MSEIAYVIGVDGGGTKTLASLADGTGRELARLTLPSTNIHANTHRDVEQVMHTMLSRLCDEGGITPNQLNAICLGMAGCDSPGDQAAIHGFLAPILHSSTQIIVINDAIVAMRALLKRLHGLLLIAGTGSICFGWNDETDATARCGGWGHILADEGSGYKIGLEALRAVLKSVDGRGPKTNLKPRIMESLGIEDPRGIIQFVYGQEGTKTNIASFAPMVMEEDRNNDKAAAQILDAQAAELFDLICPVAKNLFADSEERIPLGLWGGNLVHVENYRNRLLKHIEESGLPLDPVYDNNASAVTGAVAHALDVLQHQQAAQ